MNHQFPRLKKDKSLLCKAHF